MRPVKPDLFDTTIPALRAGPKHRFEHIAGLVQRQGMVAMLYMRAKFMVVKGMAAFSPAPQQGQPQPQGLDRVPDADHLYFGLAVAMRPAKGLRHLWRSGLLVMAVGGANIAHGCMFRLQQAYLADHPR